jgi:alpha/beta superfamily hydrolase
MFLDQLEFDRQNTATTMMAGLVGDIETLITLPQNLTDSSPIIVISHPHPLYGGTLTNKVVTTLHKSFSELGAITVRFNFRGVGKSEGEFDHGVGEAKDLAAIVKTLKEWRPQAPVWLAGFSFGSYVTTRAQAEVHAEKILLVAPPVSMYEFDQIPEIDVPWFVIQGGQDEVIDAMAVKSWVSDRPNQPQLIWMEEASHFFHGKLINIKDAIKENWLSM